MNPPGFALYYTVLEEAAAMRSPKEKQTLHILHDAAVREDGGKSPALFEEISQRAYALYERRGRQHGFDLEDWLRAELEVLAENAHP